MSIIKISNGKNFECSTENTILEEARAKGISLEYSCNSGRCGVCKAKVLFGSTCIVREEESITEDELSAGFILTCCRTALTDVSLEVDDLGELANFKLKTLPCRVDKLVLLSDDVIEVTLRMPPAVNFIYLPGQYIDVIGNGGIRRSYSIANAPRKDNMLTLQIRRVPNGVMSHYWFCEAKKDDLLRLEGPLGTFCLRPSKASRLVMLATGTGIAPIKAILEQIASNPTSNTYVQIHVFWGGRTENDLYWKPDYPSLPLKFTRVISRSEKTTAFKGYIQDAVLAEKFDLKESVVYACGSQTMIACARSRLVSAGLNPKDFFSDAFLVSN